MGEPDEHTGNRETLIAWVVTNALLLVALALVEHGGATVKLYGGLNVIVSGGIAAFCAGNIGARWGIVYRMHAVQSVSALMCLAPALVGATAVAISAGMREKFEGFLVSAWLVPLAAVFVVYLCGWLVVALLEVSQREVAQTA